MTGMMEFMVCDVLEDGTLSDLFFPVVHRSDATEADVMRAFGNQFGWMVRHMGNGIYENQYGRRFAVRNESR